MYKQLQEIALYKCIKASLPQVDVDMFEMFDDCLSGRSEPDSLRLGRTRFLVAYPWI